MLVLTRKQGERIQIGDDITITVVRTKGKSVRLGIQAPAHVPVLRGEIARAISAETEPSSVVANDETDDASGDDVKQGGGQSLSSTDGRGPLYAMVGARSV
jgi:carbon storage regulator CsrA